MSRYKIHSKESAPRASFSLLEGAEKAFGFIPNLAGVLASAPATLKAYMTLGQIFEQSSFSPAERQVAILAISRFNECGYCMAAHSVIAGMQQVPDAVIDAIRNDRPIEDARLEALRKFTSTMVEKRGWLADEDLAAFLKAGFDSAQVLEVILAISFKTISNYVNHIADTPLDGAFAARKWRPSQSKSKSDER